MNKRIFIEKKKAFAKDSQKLKIQLKEIVPSIKEINIYPFYEVFGIEENDLNNAIQNIFSNPVTDIVHLNRLETKLEHEFALEFLPGQYDQRADSAEQCLQLLRIENVRVKTAFLYQTSGLNDLELNKLKKFLINPIEKREKDLSQFSLNEDSTITQVKTHDGFTTLSNKELQDFYTHQNFSLEIDDLTFIQSHFKSLQRNPTETELKVLDTYWSDHCRHTTFETEITSINIHSKFETVIKQTLDDYYSLRNELNISKPIRLMDLATICGKYFIKDGTITNIDISEEINACSIVVPIEVDGITEEWLLQFKNETHNHPTEVEPFGGASTCIGGAIRDPLSGRAYVFQAMRVTGSGNPLESINETMEGKLPQKKITTEAAQGYSSYGNQIGLATTLVKEIYDPGYKAKRMEVGFVAGAVKKDWVVREVPKPGNKIIILGGKTGRDGVGGATGSSKTHDGKNLDELSAEVQKGNAPVERKIQRLFRKEKVIQLIKRCNDFGAGGVSVAVGELADGVLVKLDLLPKKYAGLNGTELALSESQERMAIVLEAKDVAIFLDYAKEENLEAVEIGEVTADNTLTMIWNNQKIVELSRDFLNTNGIRKKAKIEITDGDFPIPFQNQAFSKEIFIKQLADLNTCSQKGLVEMFDSSIGRSTVLMPFGGKHQDTPESVSVQKFPTDGFTNHVSMATFGYQPKVFKWSAFHGGYFAVLESVANIVAAGGDYKDIRLTFQEYFERLKNEPTRWGKPFAALLGTIKAQKTFNIAAIGGKDSMSGSYQAIDVPPTLISFAVCTNTADKIISGTLQEADSYLYALVPKLNSDFLPETNEITTSYAFVNNLIKEGKILSAKAIHFGGIAETLAIMAMGNEVGFSINTHLNLLFPYLGGIIIQSKEELTDLENNLVKLGKVNKMLDLEINGLNFNLTELKKIWKNTLDPIFPEKQPTDQLTVESSINSTLIKINSPKIKLTKPKVLIPIFPGTNSEYDSKKAFLREGAAVETFVFKNQTLEEIKSSVNTFAKLINEANILFFCGGFSAADEPEGSGKFIATILRNEKIKNSIHALLKREGLILGICNGFQALVKSGLLPYGEIKELTANSPTLYYNKIGRHISQIARVKVTNNQSPWLAGMENKTYAIPFSHGEGQFIVNKETLAQLIESGQIATQYVNLQGEKSLEMPFNPNGSTHAIEGITSPCGRIYGRMGHPERFEEGLMKNIPGIEHMNIFKNGVDYFK